MRIVHTDRKNKDFLKICAKLDDFQNRIVPERVGIYSSFNNLEKITDVFLAYDNDIVIGSAGLKPYSSDTCEPSRLFVDENYRGKNIAGLLYGEVETLAKKQGYSHLILNTWVRSTSALRLYEKLGFKRIEPPETMQLGELIVYMKKSLR